MDHAPALTNEVDVRKLAALLIVLAAGCQSTPKLPHIAPPAPTEDASRIYLLQSAAADFHEHGPAPARFRNVRYGVVEGAGHGGMPLVCGEFQVAGSEEWVHFTTLQTSKYEQWIGGQGEGFCQRPAFGWDKDDLSAELLRRVEALR